jgi:glycosyltransferase involved in cell wall biosynthesis
MRVATCTPVDFVADEHFFGRDSGLVCRGLQEIGIACVSVMPGERRAEDPADVVRASPGELSNPEWWSSLGVELVMLYAWGDPRYMGIATAIRSAGIPLVQSLDTAGLTTPYGNFHEWWQCLSVLLCMPQPVKERARLLGKALRDFIPSAFEHRRLAMMNVSDRIAAVSPPAEASVKRYASALGSPEVAGKLVVLPHPVSSLMKAEPLAKEQRVIVVGRWTSADEPQKDPVMLMEVLGDFLAQRPSWQAEVIGRESHSLASRRRGWDPDAVSRVTFSAPMSRSKLAERYALSRIIFCPSRFESFHISSGEALCCGCSVVVADHPLLASTGWFTTDHSGTLAPERTRDSLSAALLTEANLWDQGSRDPGTIARNWSHRLHAGAVAKSLLAQVTDQPAVHSV